MHSGSVYSLNFSKSSLKARLMCFFSMLCAVMLIAGSSYGQSKKELEKKKNAIQKDIEYTNQLLKQTKKNKSASLNQLVTLNKKITYRSVPISIH